MLPSHEELVYSFAILRDVGSPLSCPALWSTSPTGLECDRNKGLEGVGVHRRVHLVQKCNGRRRILRSAALSRASPLGIIALPMPHQGALLSTSCARADSRAAQGGAAVLGDPWKPAATGNDRTAKARGKLKNTKKAGCDRKLPYSREYNAVGFHWSERNSAVEGAQRERVPARTPPPSSSKGSCTHSHHHHHHHTHARAYMRVRVGLGLAHTANGSKGKGGVPPAVIGDDKKPPHPEHFGVSPHTPRANLDEDGRPRPPGGNHQMLRPQRRSTWGSPAYWYALDSRMMPVLR
jgi:hypothetical protein